MQSLRREKETKFKRPKSLRCPWLHLLHSLTHLSALTVLVTFRWRPAGQRAGWTVTPLSLCLTGLQILVPVGGLLLSKVPPVLQDLFI